MVTRIERTAHNAGGWGEHTDNQVCQYCNKKICNADLSRKAIRPSSTKCQGQGRCHNPAGSRTPHPGVGPCSLHLGNTRTVVQSSARQEIRSEMRRYGAPVPIDADEALREEIHRTVGHVRWLAAKVALVGEAEPDAVPDAPRGAGRVVDIKPKDDETEAAVTLPRPEGDDALVWGLIERETQDGGPGGGFDRVKQGASANVWLQTYMAERGHLAKICDIAMRANLEGRRQDWAEAMAARLIESFESMAEALGVDPKSPQVQAQITAQLATMINNKGAA